MQRPAATPPRSGLVQRIGSFPASPCRDGVAGVMGLEVRGVARRWKRRVGLDRGSRAMGIVSGGASAGGAVWRRWSSVAQGAGSSGSTEGGRRMLLGCRCRIQAWRVASWAHISRWSGRTPADGCERNGHGGLQGGALRRSGGASERGISATTTRRPTRQKGHSRGSCPTSRR